MSSLYSLLTSALAVSLASCSPLSASGMPQSLKARQITNSTSCQNPRTEPDASCWNSLNIASYLDDPVTGWNKTTPICAPQTEDALNCCRADEDWSTCFIRLGTGEVANVCNSITQNRGACQFAPEAPNLAPSIQGQVRYVLQNIFSIWIFFQNMGTSKLMITCFLMTFRV